MPENAKYFIHDNVLDGKYIYAHLCTTKKYV